jgi:hypothetical protein
MEEEFFAGHLRTRDGLPVPTAARIAAGELSLRAARAVVDAYPWLEQINREYQRDTVVLHLAKCYWLPFELVLLRVLSAEALAAQEKRPVGLALVHLPPGLKPEWFRRLDLGLELRMGRGPGGGDLSRARRRMLRKHGAPAGATASAKRSMADNPSAGKAVPAPVDETLPTLLVLQEDELGMDRSFRMQPHWLFPDGKVPAFRTLVLASRRGPGTTRTAELSRYAVTTVRNPSLSNVLRGARSSPLIRSLLARVLAAAQRAVTAGPVEAFAGRTTARLLIRAARMALVCERQGVQIFMTGENYFHDSDAMQIIASRLGVHTVSYQYSNMPAVSPLMMTTADLMLVFASRFESIWNAFGIHPQEIRSNGYVFDSSFSLTRERAAAARDVLHNAGARFVICYFDESVQNDRYGLIHADDHRAEVLMLLRLVLDDPTLGIVFKSQFERNSPSRLYADVPEVSAAMRTGRCLELLHGEHRNIVFPAEAAQISDIALGHIIGATAPLEAALVGTRTLLLDPYGAGGAAYELYRRSRIIFPSMGAALTAIQQFRAGSEEVENLGDWSMILEDFDPFRDGRAGLRIREHLERVVSGRCHGTSDISDPARRNLSTAGTGQ